jgi:hypothetical protein
MRLTISTLLFYGIFAINYLPSIAIECYSCASPILRLNWEATGLPSRNKNNKLYYLYIILDPENGSFFSAKDCSLASESPKVECKSGCFFAAYALVTHDYAVVRGCIEEFVGEGGISIDPGSLSCETAKSNNLVYLQGQPPPEPNPNVSN